MKKIYSFFAVLLAALVFSNTASAYKIYVQDNNNWSPLYLYAWDSSDTPILGGWPGSQFATDNKEEIGGKTWKWYDMSEFDGQTINIIFNNGNGKPQTGDIKGVVMSQDRYFSVTGTAAVEVADPSGDIPEIEKMTIYVEDKTGWSTLYCYAYGSNNSWLGGWPGSKYSGTEVINGVTYKTFEAFADGAEVNLIFNDGSGQQIPSEAEPSIIADKDYYFTVTATSVTEIDPNAGGDDTSDTYMVVGEFNGWSLETGLELLDDDNDKVYVATLAEMSGAAGFKIVKNASWETNFGSNGTGLEIGKAYAVSSADGSQNILFADQSVIYKNLTFAFDAATTTLTVTAEDSEPLVTTWTLVGDVNEWSTDSPLEFVEEGNGVYTLSLDELSGQFKVLKNNTWDGSYITSEIFTPGTDFVLENLNLPDNNIVIEEGSVWSEVTLTLTVADDAVTLRAETNAISGIENIEVESNEAVEYFNLQGVRVDNPENGLFIRKQGSKVAKVIVK